jgi:hypothetical protein
MITLSSVGNTEFSVEVSDSPLWSTSLSTGAGWWMTLRNEMQNVVKSAYFVQPENSNNRFITFEIGGVATSAAEDLTPVSGPPLIYFGKEGIGTWTWTLNHTSVAEGPLVTGYAKVESSSSSTDEIETATFVSNNEDLETIIYTS